MKQNYHTHTYRCYHASGTEREYIETAIQNGLTTLGFSDHAPYIFSNGYVSNFRMLPEATRDYFNTLQQLKEEYKDKIQIKIGFEAEYYPDIFDKFLEFIRPFGCDYLLLGQHYAKNEPNGIYVGIPTDSEAVLAEYVQTVVEGMNTGCFTYVAHPDLIYFTGKDSIYRKHMLSLCQEAKKLHMPLEINLQGLSLHRNYPCEKFFALAKEVGNTIVLGCDAHKPEDVGNPVNTAAGEAFAAKLGLCIYQNPTVKSPF